MSAARSLQPPLPEPEPSQNVVTLLAGALWGLSSLFIVTAMPFAVLRLVLPYEAWPSQIAIIVLAVAAFAQLIMVVSTLVRDEAYAWDADMSQFPSLFRWAVQLGSWCGLAVVIILEIITIVGGASSGPASARWAIFVMAGVGGTLTFFAAPTPDAGYALLLVWIAVGTLIILRGVVALLISIVRLFK